MLLASDENAIDAVIAALLTWLFPYVSSAVRNHIGHLLHLLVELSNVYWPTIATSSSKARQSTT
jgi:hypothetical protein